MAEETTLISFSNALADAAEKAGRSTVLVEARRRMPASGILYGGTTVLTADHVVERDEDIRVLLPDGEGVRASLVGRDPGTDLAVLRLESPASEIAAPASRQARVGEFVLALGRPSSNGIQASLGVVSAIGSGIRRVHRMRGKGGGFHGQHMTQVAEQYIRTDAIPYPGFSGGPLVNAAGEVVGINTSGLVRGISLAVPFERALRVASDLETHGSIKRGYLGIRSQHTPLTAAMQEKLNREQATGLLVVWIEEGAAAEAGGIIIGDVLVGYEDIQLLDHDDLQRAILDTEVGQAVQIDLLRGGEPVQIAVVIGARPD